VTQPTTGPSSSQNPASPGEIQRLTTAVQHQLNNPLAALLAEAQLLRTEPGLGLDHRAAVDRVIDITRRIIALVRDLDASLREKSRH
jgi:signal transduction histidine kinase